MIPSSEISVVIQGPAASPDGKVLPGLERVLKAVRQHLPLAELILSTWEGAEEAVALNPDRLVLSPDPGGMRYRAGHPFENNVNRQIRSTFNGLRHATRPYALKLRSDLELCGTGFLAAFDRYPKRLDSHRLFERRVVTSTLFTIHPMHGSLALFHPGDWVHFGTTHDLLKLWEIPEAEEAVIMRWHDRSPIVWHELEKEFSGSPAGLRKKVRSTLGEAKSLHQDGFACRYDPEQYIWTQALRKTGFEGFRHGFDLSPLALAEAESWLVNNFTVIHARQFAFESQKYRLPFEDWRPHLYTHLEWCRIYRQMTRDRTAMPLKGAVWPYVQTTVERGRQRLLALAGWCMAAARRLAGRMIDWKQMPAA